MRKTKHKLAALAVASVTGVGVAVGLAPMVFPPPTVAQASERHERHERLAVPVHQDPPASASSDATDIFAFNRHLIAIADKIKPTVVNISVTQTVAPRRAPFFNSPFFNDPFFRRFFGEKFQEERRRPPRPRQQGMGSGVIISADGYIVTNNHVVAAGDTIQVVLGDKRTFEADLVGTDPETDLAILKIDADELPFLSWGDSARLRVGEMVVAVGNPFGLTQTVTMGIISAVGRANVGIVDYEDFIQTDAAINPGNSGGALVNLQGDLIGINTAIFSRSGGSMGIGFAIPSNMAGAVARSLTAHGTVVRGWLGVSIQDLSPELAKQFDAPDANGALVTDVIEGSPALEGRIQRGDIIRDYDGRPVDNSTKLRTAVAETPPGTRVIVGIIREGRDETIPIAIGQLPDDVAGLAAGSTVGTRHALSGLTVESAPHDRDADVSGVRVVKVEPESRAARAGVRQGDIILEINRATIADVDAFDRVTSRLDEDDAALLLLRRGRSLLFFSVGRH